MALNFIFSNSSSTSLFYINFISNDQDVKEFQNHTVEIHVHFSRTNIYQGFIFL